MSWKFIYIRYNHRLLCLPSSPTYSLAFFYLSASKRTLKMTQWQDLFVLNFSDKIESNPPPIELLFQDGQQIRGSGEWMIFSIYEGFKWSDCVFIFFLFILGLQCDIVLMYFLSVFGHLWYLINAIIYDIFNYYYYRFNQLKNNLFERGTNF